MLESITLGQRKRTDRVGDIEFIRRRDILSIIVMNGDIEIRDYNTRIKLSLNLVLILYIIILLATEVVTRTQ